VILDSSAVIAVLREEDDRERLVKAIGAADQVGIGAPTLTELSIVLIGRFGPDGRLMLSRFLERNEVVIVPFGERHWDVSAVAFLRYGKGRHPAALNLGDCMTYATAQVAGVPLLYTGEDFAKTDIAAA
jgi:ribonuclease VapC